MNKWINFLIKSKIYFILIFIIVGFTRCQFIFDICFSDDTSISPEILPYFKKGDTLVFRCNLEVDTFLVEKSSFYDVGEDDGSGDDLNYERFISSIIQINCADSCYKIGSTIIPSEYIVCGYQLSDYDKRYANLSFQIGDYQLKDLYRIYDFKADTISGKEIVEVFYSKKYGLVKYRLTNSEVFQLTVECLEMLMERE